MTSSPTETVGTKEAESATEPDKRAQSSTRTKRPPSTRTKQIRLNASRVALFVAVLAVWELTSGRIIDDLFISRPSDIARQWWEWLVDGTLWYNASSTFFAAGVGFALGGSIAIVVGYLLAGSPRVADLVEPFMTAIYSLPKAALIPLFVLWFGIGQELSIMVSALVTFFLMFYNTFFGIRDVDQNLVDAVRILGGRRTDVAFKVRLPSALVWVAAGLKISIPQALVAVVVAEILAGNRGIGYLVSINAGQFNSAGTFAAIATLLVIGLVLDRGASLLTKRALVWKKQN